MSNKAILLYVIKILIALAQTSDMSPTMKGTRVSRLYELAKEVVMHND